MWGAVAQGVGAIVGGLIGAGQRSKGKRLLRDIGEEKVPEDILRNQALAQQMAAEGMPSEQYQRAMRNIQRQQLMALRSANSRRSALAALPAIQGGTNDATLNLDATDAQQRVANTRQLMNVNNQVGNIKRQIWERKWNYAMGLMGVGNQNIAGAIDRGIGAVGEGLDYFLGDAGSGTRKDETLTHETGGHG